MLTIVEADVEVSVLVTTVDGPNTSLLDFSLLALDLPLLILVAIVVAGEDVCVVFMQAWIAWSQPWRA